MPHSLKSKIKSLCYKGEITEQERDRLIDALETPTVKAIPKYKIDEAIEKIKTMRNSAYGSYLKTSAYKEGIDDVLLIIEEACK